MKKFLLAGLFFTGALSIAQNVNIPDVALKQKLLKIRPAIDKNGDGEISQEEAAAVTRLDISDSNISNLTGLEAFVNVKSIDFLYNTGNLTHLKLSNSKLTDLNIEGSNFQSLDLSENPKLKNLTCNNTENLTTLDFSNNPDFEQLECYESNLSSLNVENNPELNSLSIATNHLTSLDLTHNPKITYLSAYGNQFTSFDISKNIELGEVDLSDNQLTTLDASHNSKLVKLILSNNQLNSLDISFGDYANFGEFDITGNPDLHCVKITEGKTAKDQWKRDTDVTFASTCGNMSVVEVNAGSTLSVYPNPVKDVLYVNTLSVPSEIKVFDTLGRVVASNVNRNTIRFNKLSKGVYLVRVVVNGKESVKKIVKE